MKLPFRQIDLTMLETDPRRDKVFEIEQPLLIGLIGLLVLGIVFIAGLVVGARVAQSQTLDLMAAATPAPTLSITVHDAAGRTLTSSCNRVDPFTFAYPGDITVTCNSDQFFCSAFGSQP